MVFVGQGKLGQNVDGARDGLEPSFEKNDSKNWSLRTEYI